SSNSACTAVGSAGTGCPDSPCYPLVERWNGHEWSRQAVPTPAGTTKGGLWSVSCTSGKACTVGGGGSVKGGQRTGKRVIESLPVIERRSGSRWSIQAVPKGVTGLDDVSCASRWVCVAVGAIGTQPSVMAWDGSRWSTQPAPVLRSGDFPPVLRSVSC